MASTSSNLLPASSSTSPPTPSDVFLSFRGEDTTRYNFTDHLYKALVRTGIRAFKDDPALRSGDVISDSLVKAIQESKTYIVVLSENYASSSWRLDELVEILRCRKTMNRLVIPVFYYIDPWVVRRQSGSFMEAFAKHQTRYDVKKVDKWRLTLKEVADFSGYSISKKRSQADIVDEVVERVLLEINPVTLNVAKYPVGLDSRVEGVTALFNNDVRAVIKIGIHGMGGVGKTTLAKAVYKLNYRRFPGSCFLANVREVSRTTKGIVCLQQQLLDDVLKCNNINVFNVDQGIELIQDRIRSKKVLIVIDDLDDPKPLKYLQARSFAPGSMVIITTRNKDMLDRINVKARYEVDKMDDEESLLLFTQHAFGEDEIPHTFTELSKEILKHAGGLPLALQVFGSTLLNESEDGWKCFIDKLKRVPIGKVEENLMISFDALKSLDPDLQDIFLDIACLFIGWKKEDVSKILETCYTFVNRKIDILQKRCLITIGNKLGMHDLLRDMGRNIARNNFPDEPGKHSRLWVSEDIDTVLMNREGTEEIRAIISSNFLSYDYEYGYGWSSVYMNAGVTFDAQSFKRMRKLKFLYLNNVNLTGSFKQIFTDLRWLCWTYFPQECLPSEFYAEKLVILELPHSSIRTWEPPREFRKLKTLNMSGSRKLETTPNFTRLPCLETLNLECCSSLEEVHVSIGSLASLVHLNLTYCEKLRSLPDISQLSKMKKLDLTCCFDLLSISELPPNLEWIDAESCTSLVRLPDLSSLKQLKRLDITYCKALKDLKFYFCGYHLFVSEFPPNLECVNTQGCTSLERLPNLSNLKQLWELDLTNCSSLKEIQGLEELTSLKVIRMAGCNSSLLARTLTRRFFQILSEFGHTIDIFIGREEFQDWTNLSSEDVLVSDLGKQKKLGSRMSLDLQRNESHNFLAIILAFFEGPCYKVECSIKNIIGGFIWSDTIKGSSIVIVPISILSIRDGDRIEITADGDIFCGIHLLYRTKIKMISYPRKC